MKKLRKTAALPVNDVEVNDAPKDFLDVVKSAVIGRDHLFDGPYGARPITYFDWTASGRALSFIEHYLQDEILPLYANSHTEDDETGRVTTERLHQAEHVIKASMGAYDGYNIVHCGSGTTEAIHRLMQILGVYVPPALLDDNPAWCAGDDVPVVFIGPYEHHSNVVPWREARCEVIEIPPDESGGLSPDLVEKTVSDARYASRRKIACFSAASNVTGRTTDVAEVCRRLKRHGVVAAFDFAAIAPYVDINVHIDDDVRIDAVFFSPHKFVGGPGASGVLVFHESIYRRDLAPTFGGGGTVAYVGPSDHDFLDDIEARETPGTPGILQVMRTALAIQVRDAVGTERIHEIEQRHLRRFMTMLTDDKRFDVLGDPAPEKRAGIVSFNIRQSQSSAFVLHPRFVTTVLSDLFGIQTRAGCSCAGPYGHRLLAIDESTSEKYRNAIGRGCEAVKPGWVRASLHYLHDDEDVLFLLDALMFVATHGRALLGLYEVQVSSGGWHPTTGTRPKTQFGLADAIRNAQEKRPASTAMARTEKVRARIAMFESAQALVARESNSPCELNVPFHDDIAALSFFQSARSRA